jgi:hypothetical protein
LLTVSTDAPAPGVTSTLALASTVVILEPSATTSFPSFATSTVLNVP